MALEDLKKLSPRERLARLKELEESRRREIVEAQKLLSQTEQEIVTEDEERKQLPIDQLRAMDESMLQTGEEKELFKTKRFGAERKKDITQTVEKKEDADAEPGFEGTDERRARLEQRLAGVRTTGNIKQYGSALSTVLEGMQQQYQSPHQVAEDTAYVLHNTAYDRDMPEEEKWKTYGDAKSVLSALEQSGAPSEEIKYAANAVQRFVDKMKMQYRT